MFDYWRNLCSFVFEIKRNCLHFLCVLSVIGDLDWFSIWRLALKYFNGLPHEAREIVYFLHVFPFIFHTRNSFSSTVFVVEVDLLCFHSLLFLLKSRMILLGLKEFRMGSFLRPPHLRCSSG